MRLLLAASFVCAGLLLGAGGMDAAGVLERPGGDLPVVWVVAMLAYIALLIGGIARLFAPKREVGGARERLQEARRERRGAVQPSPSTEFAFEFVSTQRDLLDGRAARRRETTGMRPWVRALVVAMGCLWLAGFAGVALSGEFHAGALVWLLVGGGVLWFFVFRPLRARRSILLRNAPEQAVRLRFTARAIEVDAGEAGSARRLWRDLDLFVPAPGGLVLGFTDGLVHWLPDRAFARGERERLVDAIQTRMAQEVARSEIDLVDHEIVDEPWTWTIADIRHRPSAGGAPGFVDLTLRRRDQRRRLRFPGSVDVVIHTEGLEDWPGGLGIYRVPGAELDGLAVYAGDHGGLPGPVHFWAEDVVDLDAVEAAP